jgi:hypothetical protein
MTMHIESSIFREEFHFTMAGCAGALIDSVPTTFGNGNDAAVLTVWGHTTVDPCRNKTKANQRRTLDWTSCSPCSVAGAKLSHFMSPELELKLAN